MLIWITAPCVAIGVLSAFLVLASSVVSEELSTTTTDPPPTDDQPLLHLPFADRLQNTCDLQIDRAAPTPALPLGRRVHFELEFLRHILVYVNFTKKTAQLVLQNHTISNCEAYHIRNLPHTPTLDDLKAMDIRGALNKVYSSLLVHSGYSYLISHQLTSGDVTCSEDTESEQNLADLARDLAEKQRFIACRLQLGMRMLGYTLEDVSSVLNERVSNLTRCSSLRLLRDCQVVKSITNFLQVLDDYVSDYVSSTTSSSVVAIESEYGKILKTEIRLADAGDDTEVLKIHVQSPKSERLAREIVAWISAINRATLPSADGQCNELTEN